MFGIFKRLLLSVLSRPPKHTLMHARTHIHAHKHAGLYLKCLLKPELWLLTWKVLKVRGFHQCCLGFPHCMGQSRAEYQRPVHKWLAACWDFPGLPPTCLRTAGVLQCRRLSAAAPPRVPALPPRSPPRSWSSWKIEPTWGGSQNRKGH